MISSQWFSQHPHAYMVACLVAYWFVNSLIHKMPAPNDKSGALYKALYTALEGFAANLEKATAGLQAMLPKQGAFVQQAPPPPPPQDAKKK